MLWQKYKPLLLIIAILIYSLGVVTLLSVAPEKVTSHVIYFLLGIVLFIVVSTIDHSIFLYFWKYIYWFGFSLLATTFLLGEIRYGAARWLRIGSSGFQPSELAKIALIVSLSALASADNFNINKPRDLLKLLIFALPYLFFVFVQPDLGTTLVLIAIIIGILFYAGIDKLYIFVSILTVGIFSTPIWHMLHDYQKQRILVFINPKLDVLGSGYNVIQALIAVGSGGLVGKGFGRGTQANLSFLPAYWTDFIFASFAEEWGFIGVCTLLILFTIILLSVLYIITKNTSSRFGNFFCVGAFSVILSQFLINVGMNLGIMPVTGVTLPLVSYGGSSIITIMLLLGICTNVWRHTDA